MQTKIDEYVGRDWKIIITVVTILSVVYIYVLEPINDIQHSLDFIKNNELKHTEQNIAEIKKIIEDERVSNLERDKKLERILTKLEEDGKKLDK